MEIRKIAFIFLFVCLVFQGKMLAQEGMDPIPVSGVVVDEATLNPIPNVTVKNASRKAATMADTSGFFSLTANPGDTLIFEAMLYRTENYVVPEGFSGGRFAIIEAMQKDKVLLNEVTVRAFPSQREFERAFLSADPGSVSANTAALNAHIDEALNDPTNMQQYILDYNKKYITYILTDEAPANNFLNPKRWTEFIRNWRDGRFSDNAIEKLEGYPRPGRVTPQNRNNEPVLLMEPESAN